MKRSTAAVLAALVTIVVALPLAGCAAIAPLVKSAGESSAAANAKPTVGQCWRANDSIFDSSDTELAVPPVDCTKKHESYTVSVVALSKSLPESLADDEGDVRDSVAEAASDECVTAGYDALGTLNDLDDRFSMSFSLPTDFAWLNGARWVRCDVSLLAVGSLLSNPTLAMLPANFQDLVIDESENPQKFQVCLDTKDPVTAESDPFASLTARYADCAADPQWRERWVKNLPGDDESLPPTDETISAFGQETCGDRAEADQTWITYTPTDDSWALGDRGVECWVSNEAGPTT